MSALPIPEEALEDCGFVGGKRGAGKSNTLMVLFEHELDAGHRSVMIDPKGDRWGIRLNPDKTPSRFDIPVIGGKHGDRPVTADMGEALGLLVAENDVSCLIDLSLLSIGDKQKFMMGFAPTLLLRNKAPITLFVEEVHQFANMDLKYQPPMLVHHMANFGTMGRTQGVVMWSASQRPAQVNATLRSQSDTIVGHKVTSPLDREAFQGWFNGAGKAIASEVTEGVGGLAKGEAFVWVSETGFFGRVQFPRATTYDSGRTPKHGELIDAVKLPKLTNAAMLELLAVPAAEQDQNPDKKIVHPTPAENRAFQEQAGEIAGLRSKLVQLESERDELHGVIAGYQRAFQAQATLIGDISWPSIQRRDGTMPSEPLVIPPVVTPKSEAPAPAKASRSVVAPSAGASGADKTLPAGTRPTFAALAGMAPKGMTKRQLAARVGIKSTGTTLASYLSRLRTGGFIEERDGLIYAAPAHIHLAGDVELPPAPGAELVRFWARKLPGTMPVAEYLIAHRGWQEKAAIAEALRIDAKGTTLSSYLSRLYTSGVIEKNGTAVQLTREMMGGSW